MASLDLVHDVLDGQLVARHGVKMGRADGLTLELRPDRPPRVTDILVGAPVLADRVGRWMVYLLRWLEAIGLARGRVTRIPFDAVRVIGEVIEVDVDAESTPALRAEQELKRSVIGRIPGAEGASK